MVLLVSRWAGQHERGRFCEIVHGDSPKVFECLVVSEEEVGQILGHGPAHGLVVVGLARSAARVEAGLRSFAKFLAVHEPRMQLSAVETDPDTVLPYSG